MGEIITIDAKQFIADRNSDEPTEAGKAALSGLLSCIKKTDLKAVLTDQLGWLGGETTSPKARHYMAAITRTLTNYAKDNNWHIAHDTGFFYIFDGSYWIQLKDKDVRYLLKNASIKMGYSEADVMDNLFIDKLFNMVMDDGFFPDRRHNKQSIINLNNGSLTLGGDITLKPHDHRDFVRHKLDFDFDESAVNQPFLDYLARVLPNADTRKTLQQAAGFLFVKGLKMEVSIFLYGGGSNGKSVFFEVLTGVLGSENVSNYSLESLTDSSGYNRAMIYNKIVNYGSDIKLSRVDADLFKRLSSGETVTARLPYGNPFEMSDYAKLIFNINRLDNAAIEHTHGYFRRFLIIPFDVTIPKSEQDRDLHHKILKDKAGVLNWFIDGAREVMKNRDIFFSDECNAAHGRFSKESDSAAMFEEQEIIENYGLEGYYKTVADSYSAYKTYCLDAGYRNPLGRNNFSKRMELLGFEKIKTEGGWYLKKYYKGLF